MKKLLLFSALVSMIIITACNKQEVVDVAPDLPTSTKLYKQDNMETEISALTADFTIDNEHGQVNEAEALLLTNKSINAVSYEWDFGNGDRSTEANPSYEYDMHGYFTITLTTTDALGNSQQASQSLEVLCIFGGGSHDE